MQSHLTELRSRLLTCCCTLLLCFIGLFYLANTIFQFLAQPLLAFLPQGHLIAVNLTTPLTTPIHLSLQLSIVLCLPVLCYQLWAFVTPGLYPRERDFMLKLVLPSILLFYCGVAFAYWVVLPLIFGFFARFVPAVVQLTPDMGQYLDFTLSLFLAFGLSFEIPILLLMLIKLNLVTPVQLQKFRPYFVVLAFIFGMLLTPPDVLSQVCLALPMWLLYELGYLLSKYWVVPGCKH
jgi:sec-independent protein translocase protein TatC